MSKRRPHIIKPREPVNELFSKARDLNNVKLRVGGGMGGKRESKKLSRKTNSKHRSEK